LRRFDGGGTTKEGKTGNSERRPIMNASNDDATRQQAQNWSSQLGDLAGRLQMEKPQPDLARGLVEEDPVHPTRLPTLLARYLHRNSPQQLTAHKLKANLFMAGN
jgi:hypothetical protein